MIKGYSVAKNSFVAEGTFKFGLFFCSFCLFLFLSCDSIFALGLPFNCCSAIYGLNPRIKIQINIYILDLKDYTFLQFLLYE